MNSLKVQNVNKLSTITHLSFEYLLDFANHYRKEMINGKVLNKDKKQISKETIKTYKTVIDHISDFETANDIKIKISEISKHFFRLFEQYLIDKNLSKNSVSLYISKLKAICTEANEREIAFIPSFRIETPKEKTTKVYLTLDELTQMKKSDISKYEEKYLDFFIIGCFTGLRFNTLVKFTINPHNYIHEYDGYTYIDINSDKTIDGQSIIPIGNTVIEILKKYNGKFPRLYLSDVNNVIKKIAEKAKINNTIVVRKTEGGVMKEEFMPKYSQITSHTARRTFITLLKPIINNDDILMGMTSHKSKQQLNDYNRSSILERVLPVLGNSFFDHKF